MKVAVLGAAGGIGQALALLLKTQLPSGSELVVRHRSGYAGRGGRSKSYPHRCKN